MCQTITPTSLLQLLLRHTLLLFTLPLSLALPLALFPFSLLFLLALVDILQPLQTLRSGEEVLNTIRHDLIDKISRPHIVILQLLPRIARKQRQQKPTALLLQHRPLPLHPDHLPVVQQKPAPHCPRLHPRVISEPETNFQVVFLGSSVEMGYSLREVLVGLLHLLHPEVVTHHPQPIPRQPPPAPPLALHSSPLPLCEVLLRILQQLPGYFFALDDIDPLSEPIPTSRCSFANLSTKVWCISLSSWASCSSMSLIWSNTCLSATATMRSPRGSCWMLSTSSASLITNIYNCPLGSIWHRQNAKKCAHCQHPPAFLLSLIQQIIIMHSPKQREKNNNQGNSEFVRCKLEEEYNPKPRFTKPQLMSLQEIPKKDRHQFIAREENDICSKAIGHLRKGTSLILDWNTKTNFRPAHPKLHTEPTLPTPALPSIAPASPAPTPASPSPDHLSLIESKRLQLAKMLHQHHKKRYMQTKREQQEQRLLFGERQPSGRGSGRGSLGWLQRHTDLSSQRREQPLQEVQHQLLKQSKLKILKQDLKQKFAQIRSSYNKGLQKPKKPNFFGAVE